MHKLNFFNTSNQTEEYLQKAILSDENQDIDEAISNFEKGLDSLSDKTPRRVRKMVLPATILLAKNYMKKQEYEKALLAYRSAISLAKTDMEKMNVYEAAGKAAYLTGNYEEATSHYLQALHYGAKNTPKDKILVVHSRILHELGHVILDSHPSLTEEQKSQADEYRKYLIGEPHSYDLTQLPFYRDIGMDLLNEYSVLT
ncbi:tetratricopeptide repeat protein [Pradoshia sp.]